LILDPRAQEVRYLIVKNMSSKVRLERQRRMALEGSTLGLRGLYFGEMGKQEPFAMLHAQLSESEND